MAQENLPKAELFDIGIWKRCSKCREIKPLSEFHHQKGRPYERQSVCKKCNNEKTNNWRKKNLERYKQQQKKKGYKLKYKITLAMVAALVAKQNYKCAICQLVCAWSPQPNPPGAKNFLCVDHDHATGKVRGMLCNSCNNGLEKFKDDPALLLAAIRYLNAVAARPIDAR